MLSTVLNSVKSHVAFILNLNNYLFMSKRISSLLLILFTILFFVALLNWTVTPIQNGDLFMYLSMGKYFLTQNFYPTQDPFLFIQGGGNHFHHEWLSYLFYYNVESIWGLNAVIVVRMLFYGVLFSIPIWLAIKRKTFSYRTLGLLVLAIVSIATRVGDRAFFFSDLFTVSGIYTFNIFGLGSVSSRIPLRTFDLFRLRLRKDRFIAFQLAQMVSGLCMFELFSLFD
jgi:hypothetical protein